MTTDIMIDSDTEHLARRVAEATGKQLPEVVREAILASAKAAGVSADHTASVLTTDEKLMRLRMISDRSGARPLLTELGPDEVVEYDDQGMPL